MFSRGNLLILILLVSNFGYSQNSVGDCIGAIPVCQTVYVEEISPLGPGNIDPELTDVTCIVDERNSAWYIFTIVMGGQLGFTITPENLSNDYDWCLFNITDVDCDGIHTSVDYVASCNATGGIQGGKSCHGVTGADGTVPYSFQNFGCGNDPPTEFGGLCPLNALVPVETGETYVLFLDNWTGSTDGYTLAFNEGDAVILDTAELSVVESILVGDLECSWDGAVVFFEERIRCSSINQDGIYILNSNGEKVNAEIEVLCKDENQGFTQEIEIVFTRPIKTADTYKLVIRDAVFDLCDNTNDLYELEVELDVVMANVFVPNAFSPNNDGVNDVFTVFPNEKVLEILTFEIYSRWGELVYSMQPSQSVSWDGRHRNKSLNSSTYSYRMEYLEFNETRTQKYGTITILR